MYRDVPRQKLLGGGGSRVNNLYIKSAHTYSILLKISKLIQNSIGLHLIKLNLFVLLYILLPVLFSSWRWKCPKILFIVVRIINTLGSYCQNVSHVLVYIKRYCNIKSLLCAVCPHKVLITQCTRIALNVLSLTALAGEAVLV